jgi:hypothetical protein
MAHDDAGKWIGYGLNDVGPAVVRIQHRLIAAYPKNSKAKELGVTESGRYDQATFDAVFNIQPFLGLPATGVANAATQRALGAVEIAKPVQPVPVAHRKIHIFTAPGSGADWNIGPSFDLGEMVGTDNRPGDQNRKNLHINHQPLGFIKGGYLGALGGDPTFSYVEVTWDECRALREAIDSKNDVTEALRLAAAYCAEKDWNADSLTDAQLEEIGDHLELELWFSGYSQSADGMEDALEVLFGDGGFVHPGDPSKKPSSPGIFRILRGCINGVIQFGNPSKEGTGIARKTRPAWLARKIRNIFAENDFYAIVPTSDSIRPAFYAIIIEAEMELPFFVHVLRVAVPIIMNYVPFLGLFGPLGQLAVAAMAGLTTGTSLLSQFFGQANKSGDEKVDADLEKLLAPQGVLANIPGLIGLIGALPGLQRHGEYHLPMPEYGGRTGPQAAYDIIAGFRR